MRLEDLSRTITKAYELKGINISQGDAAATAETVLSYFGYGDYCLSNSLEADALSVFYELEEMGIIKTYSENENLNVGPGMVWRVLQFQLDYPGMERINSARKENGIRHEASIYDDLPDSAFVSPEINVLEEGEEEMKLTIFEANEHPSSSDFFEYDRESKKWKCKICKNLYGPGASRTNHLKVRHPGVWK